MYEVQEKLEDDSFMCVELNIEAKIFQDSRTLNFGHVGIFKNHGYTVVQRILRVDEISGKVLKLDNLLITVPRNVLVER